MIHDEYFEVRKKKRDELIEQGINPYPATVSRSHTARAAAKLKDGTKKVSIAGRLMLIRDIGKICFAHIQDESGRIQIVFNQNEIDSQQYKFFLKYFDLGDFIAVQGEIMTTKAGEKSLLVKKFQMASKSLRPLPDKWHGLTDDEERYRKRYLDMVMNPEVRELFEKKAKFWEVTRSLLKKEGFIEVETPTLEVTTGGAEANPFKTHHDDFDLDVFLRISVGELWQKRLMAAGFSKVFEIGRVYRNEGSSPEHLQEFTNMEFYWAYADYRDGMKLAEALYKKVAKEVFGKTKFTTRGHTFDLAKKWEKIEYVEEVKRQTGIDVLTATDQEMKKKLKELGVRFEGENRERLTDTLWKYCRKNIAGPVFLIHHPKLVSPLAKAHPSNPMLTERFQIIIAGSEIGNGFSELNDPIDQAERFELQRKLLEAGDAEAMQPDWEFVEMLEHGMPPTCGFGFGSERFFAFMADKSIRETQLFPLMKPKD